MARTTLVIVQAATFIVLGGLLLSDGQTRLGLAQLLLAAITGLIYI